MAETTEGKGKRGGKRFGAGRPPSDRDDVPVKVDRDVVARAGSSPTSGA